MIIKNILLQLVLGAL